MLLGRYHFKFLAMDEIKTMDSNAVKQNVRTAYGKIAQQQTGCGCGTPTTDTTEFAVALGYAEAELNTIPAEANLGLSCGNPTDLAQLKPGEIVLDLGSGAGFDCFIAATKVGATGKAIGVDMTPEMIAKATENAQKSNVQNVEFRLGEIENLPVADETIDVVISNCVINLSPDKPKVFQEIYRVLKPNGRIAISDTALKQQLSESVRQDIGAYVGCVAGALLVDEYQKIVETAGFQNVKVTVRQSSSCCGDAETKDPIGQAIVAASGVDAAWQNDAVSVYVEGFK
ncbi:MAG: 2-methoxy-6-polyprenyl-1,4-benzoquinol methylase, mitochondrial [Chroococcidiopsis cubana SAG 39.79]|nr:arsenite methyltransferase [Chroococcidiopsis cubana]MDZ4871844.1 2-methoxy-6-polyprenyl-1,4-benzoquinol methylase, mitochondrial [Chroococcidiopsis cubana SAG 39.79]PSB61435.1 arsenite S-adenosylmethyltransferase [Chroococcidiopsis cubana CCALA 043]